MSSDAATLRAEDAIARRLAQAEFAIPLVLEAGAGTGKTATLVARIVTWCLGPGWERAVAALEGTPSVTPERIAARALGRVVAITFTEAAAAEMATRVEEAFVAVEGDARVPGLDAAALPELDVRVARATLLRDALDHLVVHTLHAYARRLLSSRPFEAGLHPQLEVDADGRIQARVVRDVLDAALRGAFEEDGDALWLAAEGFGPAELEAEILALREAGVTAADLAEDLLAQDRIDALLERASAALGGFAAASEDGLAKTGGRNPRTHETLDALRHIEAALPEPGASLETFGVFLARVREVWPEEAQKRLAEWAKGAFNKGESTAIGDRAAATAAAAIPLARVLRHSASLEIERLARGRDLLGPLLAAIETELRRRGVESFSDLVSHAAALLERRRDVAAALRGEIDQLLVDEFQDTDPQQCAIVGALALDGPVESRPGLFLVGDPKQSIYGWRSADLAAYEAFVDRVCAAGGARHRLSVNYRSLPAVLDEVERAIEPVMLREPGVQPAFEPLLPSEENAERSASWPERFASVEHWIAGVWDAEAMTLVSSNASEVNALEARALASDLRALHDRHDVAWRDVGLLFRSRGDWDVYLVALREAGVPFSVEGDRSYFRRREIIDAAALVRCVLDPNDQVALVGLLRSVVVGVPDAAWIPLWARGLPDRIGALDGEDAAALEALRRDAEAVAEALPRDIPGIERVRGWPCSFVAAAEAIGALRRSFEIDPADVFVEKLRASLLLEATEAARFLGPWRIANLERFFRDLAADLAVGGETQEVLRRVRQAVAEEEPMEEEPPHDAAEAAVQILTLHGAKGLDFEHVYLVQLHKGTGPRPGPRIEATRLPTGLELQLLGAPTPGFDLATERRERVAEAERVRLLYVGMTRAKQRLVLSGAWPAVMKRRPVGDMHGGLLEHRRDLPDAMALAERAAAEGVSALDVAGARFVLPALRAEVAAPPAAEGARDAGSDDDAAAHRIAREAARAEIRMARPLAGRASEVRSGDADEPALRERTVPARDAETARLVGIVVHRVLERLDLAEPIDAGVEASLDTLEALLDPGVPRDVASAALAESRALLERLRGGALFSRLDVLRRHVVARELPVLATPSAEADALAFVSGTIDLVYRDPANRELVVVDYKSDVVPPDEGEGGAASALARRAAHHAGQGATYQRAIREALALDREPRFEVWFLAADRCVAIRALAAADPEQMSLTLGAHGK